MDSIDPPLVDLLSRGLASYISYFRSPQQLQIVRIPDPLDHVNWTELWSIYSQKQGAQDPVCLTYSGSLGDLLDLSVPRLTLADRAADWRLPVLLTLPCGSWCLSQAVAFAALARIAQANLAGIVLFEQIPHLAPSLPMDYQRSEHSQATQVFLDPPESQGSQPSQDHQEAEDSAMRGDQWGDQVEYSAQVPVLGVLPFSEMVRADPSRQAQLVAGLNWERMSSLK